MTTTTTLEFYRELRTEATMPTTNFATSQNGRVTARFEVITPAAAKAMLERNTNNRSISPSLVTTYAIDMTKKRWYLNTGGIGFDVNGVMVDGQHRLEAICESGQAQEMIVVEGLDPEARKTIDTGRKRTVADELRMRGIQNNNTLAAAVRMRMLYEDEKVGMTREMPFTSQDIIFFAEQWDDHFQPAISIARATAKNLTGVSPMVLACAYSIFHEIDPDLTDHYFDKLRTGENMTGVILTIYKKFQMQGNGQARLAAAFNLWILIRGWNALRKGEELKRIILPDYATGKAMLKAI